MQLENYDEIMLNFEDALTKRIDRLKYEYSISRAGRANPKKRKRTGLTGPLFLWDYRDFS